MREKQLEIIREALGETSALFMSLGIIPAGKIIMPSEELMRIAEDTVNRLSENVCEKNCPDYKGMDELHKKQCTCSCHQ